MCKALEVIAPKDIAAILMENPQRVREMLARNKMASLPVFVTQKQSGGRRTYTVHREAFYHYLEHVLHKPKLFVDKAKAYMAERDRERGIL